LFSEIVDDVGVVGATAAEVDLVDAAWRTPALVTIG
jgi:hypothetical protein